MKINKENIIKYTGMFTIASAISISSFLAIDEAFSMHFQNECIITKIEDSLGLDGNRHQIEQINREYQLEYSNIHTSVINEYRPRYISFSYFKNGLCRLYNIDTLEYEEVYICENDYITSLIGVKKIFEKEYIEPSNVIELNYRIVEKIITTEVKEIINEDGTVTYLLPEGFSLKTLYTLKEPVKAYKTKCTDKENSQEINYLLLTR